jgi:hypothetical protein
MWGIVKRLRGHRVSAAPAWADEPVGPPVAINDFRRYAWREGFKIDEWRPGQQLPDGIKRICVTGYGGRIGVGSYLILGDEGYGTRWVIEQCCFYTEPAGKWEVTARQDWEHDGSYLPTPASGRIPDPRASAADYYDS